MYQLCSYLTPPIQYITTLRRSGQKAARISDYPKNSTTGTSRPRARALRRCSILRLNTLLASDGIMGHLFSCAGAVKLGQTDAPSAGLYLHHRRIRPYPADTAAANRRERAEQALT